MIKFSYIKKLPNTSQWRVYSESGKNLGTYSSLEKAKKRLRQIEFFKRKKSFTDIYFENMRPNNMWKLEPRNQPNRTLMPVLRNEQLDDIGKTNSIRKVIKISPSISHRELGVIPKPKQTLKFIVENPEYLGLGTSGVPSGVRETSTSPKLKPITVRIPQNLNREHNVEWVDKLSFKGTFKFDPNSTENEGRWRLKDPDLFVKDSYRRWREWAGTEAPDGIYFLVGKLISTGNMSLQAIRFDKALWTEKKASGFWNTVMDKKGFEKTWLSKDWIKNSLVIDSSESSLLVPYGDRDDGFHRTKLKKYDDGHRPFMRDKKPGEGLSKIPYKDLPDKMFFETNPKVIKRFNVSANEESDIYERAISIPLYKKKKYITELEAETSDLEYMARMVWIDKGYAAEDIDKKWQELTTYKNDLFKRSGKSPEQIDSDLNKFIKIYTQYKRDYDSISRKRSNSMEEGFNPPPYYGDTNVYPYRGTGPALGISTQLDLILTSEPQSIGKAYASANFDKVSSFWDKLKTDTFHKYIENMNEDVMFDAIAGAGYKYKDEFKTTLSNIANAINVNLEDANPNIWNILDSAWKRYRAVPTSRAILINSDYEDKSVISDEAYEALLEKGYAFKKYKLSPTQIINAIDEGKDISLLLKYQELTPEQKSRAYDIAIEKKTSLVFLYENELESMTDKQKQTLINVMYDKAETEGTNLVFVLKFFDLTQDQKDKLIMKGLGDGVGLHYMFKNKLLSPKQTEYAVYKALDTGFGLLDLLKYIELSPEQENKIIDKCIEKGVALIYILKHKAPTKDQQARIFNKALKYGKGYYYLLRRFKLGPEQVKVAIRKSRDNIESIRYLLRYQEVTSDQRIWLEERMEVLKSKQREEREKKKKEYFPYKQHNKDNDFSTSSLNIDSPNFEKAQLFFKNAPNSAISEMYTAISNHDLDAIEELVTFFGLKKSFEISGKEDVYGNASIQTSDIDNKIVEEIRKIQASINPDILNSSQDESGWIKGGIQDLLHITILYGIPNNSVPKVEEVYSYKPMPVRSGAVSYFDDEKDNYTVAVLKCISPALTDLHYELKSYIDNKHGHEYKPHITIAYLNYGERLDDISVPVVEWDVNNIEVVETDGDIYTISEYFRQ